MLPTDPNGHGQFVNIPASKATKESGNCVFYVEPILEQQSQTGYVKSVPFVQNINRLIEKSDQLDLPKHLISPFVELLKEFRPITENPSADDAVKYNTKEELHLREKEGSVPVFSRPRFDLGPIQLKELQTQIQFLLAKGFIRPARSPYGCPVLFAPKADGKLRMACDYRQLNNQLVDDHYNAGKISDIMDQLSGDALDGKKRAKYYSSMDLMWAYWQFRVHEDSVEKTAIVTPLGSYEWLVCPFGLKTMPALCQRVVESVLRPYLHRFCLIYFDDCVVYSSTPEEHLLHIRLVLQALTKANLRIKLEKCTFFQKNIKLLGWIVGRDGRQVDPEKVKSISEFKQPETYPQLSRFLGMIEHVRDIIPKCSEYTSPLHEMTKGKEIRKTVEQNYRSQNKLEGSHLMIDWTSAQIKAFEKCRKILCTAPILQLVNPSLPFVLQPDSSETVVSAALFQNVSVGGKPPGLHPVAYHSRKLSETESRWHIQEKEALAIVEPLRMWEKYFYYGTAKVKVLSDSNPAMAILKMKKPKPKHYRWLLDLQQLNLEYQHVPGVKNRFADAMTRVDHINLLECEDCSIFVLTDCAEKEKSTSQFDQFVHATFELEAQCNAAIEDALETTTPRLVDSTEIVEVTPALAMISAIPKMKALYASDPLAKAILQAQESRLARTAELAPYRVLDGYIFYWPKHATQPRSLYVPNDIHLRKAIISAYHGTVFTMHFDSKRTSEKILRHFYWPTLREDVKIQLKACEGCLRGKYRTSVTTAMNIPSEIPPYPWACIGTDAKTGLPTTRVYQNDMFWVICDYFTGMMHLIPGRKTGMTATRLAHIFLQEVYRHHGMPLKIISDRDGRFTSHFWQEFWEKLTVILNMSTARSPWTDGKSERYIRTAIEQIRIFCRDNPTDWDMYLPAIEFAFNDCVDPVKGFSPFQLNQLTEPHTPISLQLMAFKRTIPALSELTAGSDGLSLEKFAKVKQLVSERLAQQREARRRYLEKRGLLLGEFHKGAKVMIQAPAKPSASWDGMGALEDRFIGPFTLGDEVRLNKWVIKEWENSSSRFPIVDTRKLRLVGEPLEGSVDAEAMPDRPPLREYLGEPVVRAPAPAAPAAVAPAPVPPSVSFAMSVTPVRQTGSLANPDVLDFDHSTFGIRVSRTAENTESSLPLSEIFRTDHAWFEEFNKFLDAQPDAMEEIRRRSFEVGTNEINRYASIDDGWARVHKKKASKIWRTIAQTIGVRKINPDRPGTMGIVCEIDALMYSCGICILWSSSIVGNRIDDDLDDMGVTAFRRLPSYVTPAVNKLFVTLEELRKNFDDTSVSGFSSLLRTVLPGPWSKSTLTRLFNQQFGQLHFHPSLVPTEPGEIHDLLRYIDPDYLQTLRGLDPFGGTRTIEKELNKIGIYNFHSNDVNPMLHDTHSNTTHYDALKIATLVKWKLEGITYTISSPPFQVADIALPLFEKSFDINIVHVPSDFITGAPAPRREFIRKLAVENRIHYLAVSTQRNKSFGRFCQWLIIAKSSGLIQKLLVPNCAPVLPVTLNLLYHDLVLPVCE